MHSPLVVVVTIALASSLCAAPEARADDSKVVPATACKFYGTQGADTHFSPQNEQANGLKNTSSEDRFVVCPIVRDILRTPVEYCAFPFGCETSYLPSTVTYAEVNVRGDATCGLWSRPQTGGSATHWSPFVRQFAEPDSYGHLFFSRDEVAIIGGNRSMAFYCRVAPGAAILNYRWDEE